MEEKGQEGKEIMEKMKAFFDKWKKEKITDENHGELLKDAENIIQEQKT